MANHAYIRIEIGGTKESVARVKNRILVTEDYITEINKRNDGLDEDFKIEIPKLGELTFNRLVPKPTNIYCGDIGYELRGDELYCRAFETYGGKSCWWAWNEDHWGTISDAYRQSIKMPSAEVLYIDFVTSWSPPYEYLEKLAQACIAERCDMRGCFNLECSKVGEFYIDSNNELCIECQDIEF